MDRGSPTAFRVDGTIALHSLMSLGDAHLQKLADVLTIIATTDAARSRNWERIRPALAAAARMNAPAAHWFARIDGTYWTLEQGLETGKLSDRAYFPRVLAGQTVIGDLVVSRSTHRNAAIVAVPVRGSDQSVIGVLGASVYLDSLGALVRQQMGGLQDGLLFFAIDATPRGAIHSDPSMIFTEPMKLGDESMRRAFTQMLSSQEGVVTYTFQGSRRTVLYRKSPLSNWWYGFGVVQR
jgi:methyl-accepting chemotaxis protein